MHHQAETTSHQQDAAQVADVNDGTPDCLEQFSTQEQKTILTRYRTMLGLSYHIGKDFSFEVELAATEEGIRWSGTGNNLQIDPQLLLNEDADIVRAQLARIGAARRITRKTNDTESGLSFISSCIEEARAANFAQHVLPEQSQNIVEAVSNGIRHKEEKAELLSEKLGYSPQTIQAGIELLHHWKELEEGKTPQQRKYVNQENTPDARNAWNTYPTKREADTSEDNVLRYAQKSTETVTKKVWPHFHWLLEKDIKQGALSRWLSSGSGKGKREKDKKKREPKKTQCTAPIKAVEKSLDSKEIAEIKKEFKKAEKNGSAVNVDNLSEDLLDKVRKLYESLPEEEREEFERAAKGELQSEAESLFKTHKQEAEEETDSYSDGDSVRMNAQLLSKQRQQLNLLLNRNITEYDKVLLANTQILRRFVGALKRELRHRLEDGTEGGYTTGSRIDLNLRMQEKARGIHAVNSRAWQRDIQEEEFDYAITVLVDLSPSMAGKKIARVQEGAIISCEGLTQLSIPFELLGFHSSLHTFKEFKDALTHEVKEKIGGVRKSIGSCTDLGWAIDEASLRLNEQESRNKILVVLTDGEPSPSSSHGGPQYEMKTVIDRVRERGHRIVPIGIEISEEVMGRNFPGIPFLHGQHADGIAARLPRMIEESIRKGVN